MRFDDDRSECFKIPNVSDLDRDILAQPDSSNFFIVSENSKFEEINIFRLIPRL